MQSCDRGYLDVAIAKKNCQWNLQKTVAKIFGQWKSGWTLCLFFSCSDRRPHMLLYSTFQTNSFRFIHLLFCIQFFMWVYNSKVILFYYLNSVVAENKHSLIQVTLLLYITIRKSLLKQSHSQIIIHDSMLVKSKTFKRSLLLKFVWIGSRLWPLQHFKNSINKIKEKTQQLATSFQN